jgi:hypothetical protein
MFIPTLLLKKLYTLGSLTNVEQGVRFGIKNRLSSVEITAVLSVVIDDVPAALDQVAAQLHVKPGQIALAWLLERVPPEHQRERRLTPTSLVARVAGEPAHRFDGNPPVRIEERVREHHAMRCHCLAPDQRLRGLRAHGWTRHLTNKAEVEARYPDIDPRFCFVTLGYNFRPMEVQGAMLRVQLRKMEAFNACRRDNLARIEAALTRDARFGAIGLRLPRRLKAQLMPDAIDVGIDGVEIGRQLLLADEVGDRMHDGSESSRGRARCLGLRLLCKEPRKWALEDGLQTTAGQAHGPVE